VLRQAQMKFKVHDIVTLASLRLPILTPSRSGAIDMSRLALILLFVVGLAVRAEPPAEALALQRAMHKIIDTAEPSVACILVSRSDKYAELGEGPSAAGDGKLGGFNPVRHRFGAGAVRELIRRLDLANPETVPEAYGSGIVIDDRGLVLTNYHVIERATKVYVRLPGANRGSYADIMAADGRSDLAVLKLLSPPVDLKAISFGDGGKVRKGDWIVVMANPFSAGFRDGSASTSWGIVSNVRRRAPGPPDETKRAKPLAQFATLIQTDARLNLGSSGGALLNLDGELVGLTTSLAAIAGGETAGGYAIPIDANVRKMIEILKRGEEVEYGFLGVTVNPDARAFGRGVVIGDVAAGLPAARAKMKGGDIVTSINGNPIREQEDLFVNISAALAGSEVQIEALRNGTEQQFKVRLAKSSHAEPIIASNRPKPVFGLRVDYSSILSIDSNPPEGVLVKELEPGSAAEKKLKDWADRSRLIVVAVDGQPVPTPAEFYRLTAGKKSVTIDFVEAIRDSTTKRGRIVLP
jgi:serine protease Do